MFAFVRFLEDNVCYALPVSCVQGFRPRSRADFDSQRAYDVYRGPEVGDSRGEPPRRGQHGLQRAQILALADDKMDLENQVNQKKIKIPNLYVSASFDDTGDHYEEDEVQLRHSKRLEGRKVTESAHKSLEAVVARLEKQNGMTWSHLSSEEGYMDSSEPIHIDCIDSTAVPRSLYEELLRSYQQQQQQMRHIQQELERTRRQLVQQAKKLKEYGCLVSEVKELRDLNRRLQDLLLLRLGSVSASDQGLHGMDSQDDVDSSLEVSASDQGLRGMDSQDDVDSSLEDRVNSWWRCEAKQDVCTQQVIWRHSSSPAAKLSDSSDGPPIKVAKVKTEIIEPEPELPKTISEEANTSSYYPVPVMDKYILENGKNPCPDLAAKPLSSRHRPQVHIGSGIWVDEEKWHQLQVTQGDSKFTKNLAVMIWGTDVLKNRSVTGVATKKKKDAIPKPPLSPHKLSLVRECLYDRIAQETVSETKIATRLSKVNKYICEKIMDINKSCKNEARREAKFHRK